MVALGLFITFVILSWDINGQDENGSVSFVLLMGVVNTVTLLWILQHACRVQ